MKGCWAAPQRNSRDEQRNRKKSWWKFFIPLHLFVFSRFLFCRFLIRYLHTVMTNQCRVMLTASNSCFCLRQLRLICVCWHTLFCGWWSSSQHCGNRSFPIHVDLSSYLILTLFCIEHLEEAASTTRLFSAALLICFPCFCGCCCSLLHMTRDF